MGAITGDELRKRVEWARNNGKVTHEAGGGVRFEHEGQLYLIPAELLTNHSGGPETEVDLSAYAVPR